MKQIIETYNSNRFNIEFYIKNMIKNFDITNYEENALKYILNSEKSIELIYYVNNEYKQITPSIWRYKVDDTRKGVDKSSYFKIFNCDADCVHISNPYIQHENGQITITYSQKSLDGFIVIDFNIIQLLDGLKLIEDNSIIKKVHTVVISISSLFLTLISLFLILYGSYLFLIMLSKILSYKSEEILHIVFSSIISINIGIAVYDLSKTLVENEVFYKKNINTGSPSNNTIIKFLNSIIIALSIESLMIVFKIVLVDYTKMLYALYLIIGITLLIMVTSFYSYLLNKNK